MVKSLNDYMIRATAANGQIRAFAAITTNTVQEAHTRHETSPVVSAGLGRSLTAAAMMGWQMKAETDKLNLRFEGDGPVGAINALANNKGEVWGYAKNPQVDLPPNSRGKLDVSGSLGHGVLSVIMDLGLKEPYCGQIELVTGEIAEDLTYYYTVSEQIPSAVGLGVLVDVDCSIKVAGGFILQMMPGASEEAADQLASKVEKFPSVTAYFNEGHTPEELLEELLGDMDLEIKEKHDIGFHCTCDRARVTAALLSIGEADLRELAEGEEDEVILRCNLCNEPYVFTREELNALADEAASARQARQAEK